jgi:hypothetical protein
MRHGNAAVATTTFKSSKIRLDRFNMHTENHAMHVRTDIGFPTAETAFGVLHRRPVTIRQIWP